MTLARPLRGRRCVVWIAAYPKSGSTWLRALLANFLSASGEPIAVNALRAALPGGTTGSREHFDEFTGFASADCTDEEVASLRPMVFRARAERQAAAGEPYFYVAHDAYAATPAGEPLFPDDVTSAAVYLVRHPLDVAVSWTYYAGLADFAAGVRALRNGRARLRGADWPRLGQRLLDWSGHVRSWRGAPFPMLTVRYEDLLADTAGALGKLARFLRLPNADDQARLRRAVAFSDFAALRRSEREEGFDEAPQGPQAFFRSGRVGDGRRLLSAAQIGQVLDAHGRTMATLGYC